MCTCPSTTAMVIINVVMNPQQTIIPAITNTKLHNYEINTIYMDGVNINLSKKVHQIWLRKKKNYESCNNNMLTSNVVT